MVRDLEQSGLGRGIYSIVEVARYTGVPSSRVRRWVRGYDFKAGGRVRHSEPVITRDFEDIDGDSQLSFLDLVEVRVVDAFLRLGVGWNEVRRASKVAVDLLHSSHPFATLRFRTDGQAIFAKISDELGDDTMLQLAKRQHVFREVIEPTLRGLEFTGDELMRWWPLGQRRRVVLDPRRSFGRPVGVRSGVPTEVLVRHALATSVAQTARWYEVDVTEIRHAMEFEKRMAA